MSGRVLVGEARSGMPLVVETGSLGSGSVPMGRRVVMLNTDEAWRWSPGFFDALASMVIEKPYAATEGNCSLDASVSGDDVVTLRARFQGLGGTAMGEMGPPVLAVRRAGQLVREVQTHGVRPGRFEAVVNDLPEGDYTVSLREAELPKLSVLVGDAGQRELMDVEGERASLEPLGRQTGGVVGDVWDLAAVRDRLAATVAPKTPEAARLTVDRWWCSPAMMTLLAGLLCMEWALRKHWGLA